MFVTGRIAITESGVVAESAITPNMNVVFIYPRMPYGVKNAVMGAAARVDVGRTPRGRRGANRDTGAVDFNLGQWNLALLLHNIVGWGGPAFAQFPYSDEAKARFVPMIDDTAPLWQRVIKEINDRNTTAAEGDDPKSISSGAQSSEGVEESSPADLILN